MDETITRRSLLNLGLRSVAGAGLISAVPKTGFLAGIDKLTARPLRAPSASGARALVCIYCFDGGDHDHFLASGGGMHPSLAELQPLYQQKALAVVTNVAAPERAIRAAARADEMVDQRYSALRFLPNGYATLEWAARLADVEAVTGRGAYTFESGMSLVAPGARLTGEQFENATIREATSRLSSIATSFPDGSLGRQLEDVSRLLRVSRTLGMTRQVFFVGANGFTRNAHRAGTLAARYRDLSRAMAAFYQATVELGVARQVTTYTDGEFAAAGDSRRRAGSRLVLGGAVVGGDVYANGRLAQDSYAGAMATWFGADGGTVAHHFPEFEASRLAVMA